MAVHPPYDMAIQQAIVSGDLAKMKTTAREAEQYLADHGDVPSALAALKIEIAKLEAHK
jgi:hypothetical protein